jgi:hypothetical protein
MVTRVNPVLDIFRERLAVYLPDADKKQQKRRFQRGQAMVEFSLSLVILMMIMSGMLDLGRLYYIYVALEDGAGEGALYLSINPDCRTVGDIGCPDPNNAEYRVRHAASGVFDWNDPVTTQVTFDVPLDAGGLPDYGVGDTVTVHIRHRFEPVTPIIIRISEGLPIWLTVEATQIIITKSP